MTGIVLRFEEANPSPDSFVKIEVMAGFGAPTKLNTGPTKGSSTQKRNVCIVPVQLNDTSTHESSLQCKTNRKPRFRCDAKFGKVPILGRRAPRRY